MKLKYLRRRAGKYTSSAETHKKHVDWMLVLIVLALSGFGLLMVYDASAASALRDFGDRFHYLREQFRWLMFGLAAMAIASFFPYKKLYFLSVPMLIGCIVLLLAVFIPGLGVRAYGAHRWLNFGIFILQPSEVTKLALVLYLSAWFTYKEKNRLMSFLLLMGIVVGLILLQPDMGTAFVTLLLAFILYFASGASYKSFSFLIPLIAVGGIILALIAPYRAQRVMTFFNPQGDPLGSSYHIRQVLISLGSGGIFGVGLGNSLQKYEYVPESMTDSIFAIIGEELGLIGSVVLMSAFVFFLLRGFRIATRAPDRFGQLMGIGITSLIGVQAAINLSSMVALIPLTGIPLPFISYGGSSLVILFTCIGILLNISRK